MDVHSSNLALFESPPVESAIECVEWIHFAPLVTPKRFGNLLKPMIGLSGNVEAQSLLYWIIFQLL